MVNGRDVLICEVCPRDGFQMERDWVPTTDKIALVNALSAAQFSKIEVSSFVSPKAIPNLRDASELFGGIVRQPSVTFTALVPNVTGAVRAMAAAADEINFVSSVSETHNLANMRMTCERSLASLGEIVREVDEGIPVNATVATAFGCPFEGRQPPGKVLDLVDAYRSIGATSVTLADTTGMANPRQVAELVNAYQKRFGALPLTLHFHDTRGLGLANIYAAFREGIVRFDASLGGLGGCPYAPGATGNVCTEDVIHMFEQMGVRTGVNLNAVIEVSQKLASLVGHDVPGHVMKVGPAFAEARTQEAA